MRILIVTLALVSQAAAPIFRFDTDGFWLNLHHFLYVLGRAEAKMPDIGREAVAGAPADQAEGVKTLSEADQQAWRESVSFYAKAMHQWDEEIDARLKQLAKANNLKFNDLLSHAMIFYTTGEAVRSVVPGHTPYAELAGIWKGRMGFFKPRLDAHWKPYLDGKSTLDAALLGLLKS